MIKKRLKIDNTEILKKKYYNFEKRLLINVITCVLTFMLSLILIVLSIRMSVKSNLRYYQTSNLDYKVNLKNNNYYEENTLKKDMQYIASLIDTIDVNFNYNFKVSEKINYKYYYYVNAEVKVTDENTDNVIFSRKDKVTEDKKINMTNSNNFNINELVKVNYEKYNNVVKSFKSEYAINAKSNLILSLYVLIEDEGGKELKTLKADNSMNIIIPLTEQMINIKLDYKEINNSDTFVAKTNFEVRNKILFVIGIILSVLFIISIIKLFMFLNKLKKKKSPYDKELSKILREYDRIIVEAKRNLILESQKQIIDVKTFSELLDVRDNLEKPIVFYEVHKGQKSIFIVNNQNEAFRYVLKLVDLEKDNKDAK